MWKNSIIRSRLWYLALWHGKLVKLVWDEKCFFLSLHFAVHLFRSPLFCGLATSVIHLPVSITIFFFFLQDCLCHLVSLLGSVMYSMLLFCKARSKWKLHCVMSCHMWSNLLLSLLLHTSACRCLSLGRCTYGPFTKYRNCPKIAEYFLCSLVLQLQADIGPYSVEVCVIVHTAAILICVLVGIINFTVPYACYPHV